VKTEATEIREARPEYNPKEERIPPGYKRTEVGVIPEDWEVRPVLDEIHIRSGQVDPRLDPYSDMVLIAPDHVEEATGRIVQHRSAAAQGARSGKYLFAPNDVVYSKIRPYLRKACIVDEQGLCSADMYALSVTERVVPHYLLHVLLGKRFTDFAVSVSARSGIPKVNREELAEFRLIVPPLPEQRAIARALSDVDDLISALDKLIEKKRAIKQATMQQLLTGRTRLPGFGGEWSRTTLGRTGELSKGQGIGRDDVVADGLPCIRYGELYTLYRYWTMDTVSRVSVEAARLSRPIHKGDLLFAASGETAEEIGACVAYLGDETVYAGGDTIVLTPIGVDSRYLGYLLNYEAVAAQKSRMAQGDAVVHISARNLARVEIDLPPLPEQRAIAAVLSHMDAGIGALEGRREKTRLVKQGMMQELLTGRIRLVEDSAG